jgi:hypothetical protein
MLIPGEPCAVKVACPVRRGGWGNTDWLCALPLPYRSTRSAGKPHTGGRAAGDWRCSGLLTTSCPLNCKPRHNFVYSSGEFS